MTDLLDRLAEDTARKLMDELERSRCANLGPMTKIIRDALSLAWVGDLEEDDNHVVEPQAAEIAAECAKGNYVELTEPQDIVWAFSNWPICGIASK